MALLVERVDIGADGLNVRLRVDGLTRPGARDVGRQIASERPRDARAQPRSPDTVTLHVPFRAS